MPLKNKIDVAGRILGQVFLGVETDAASAHGAPGEKNGRHTVWQIL